MIGLEYIANAWDETVGYLADGWSVFSTYLKQRWNDATGFIRKAWVKLKSLISDIDVEVEMRKIDDETQAANRADEQARNRAIAERMEKRQSAARRRRGVREAINAQFQGGGVNEAGRQRIEAAEQNLESTVNAANEIGEADQSSEQPELPNADQLAVGLPTLETPELQAPDTKDLELSLDRDSADAINGFGADTESVTASFDAAGMGFGKDVSALKPVEQPPAEKELANDLEKTAR